MLLRYFIVLYYSNANVEAIPISDFRIFSTREKEGVIHLGLMSVVGNDVEALMLQAGLFSASGTLHVM